MSYLSWSCGDGNFENEKENAPQSALIVVHLILARSINVKYKSVLIQ